MAYDEGLTQRIRECFLHRSDVEEKKMFGGVCFMVSRHMCCGVVGDTFMARVGPKQYEDCLAEVHAAEMLFTGKPMNGMVYVSPEGIESDAELSRWIGLCESFITTLPPKP